jgi:Tfp pilus assembly ATPase PilU
MERDRHSIHVRPAAPDGAKKGSDLFITAGFPPAIKIDGKMTPQSSSR